MSNIISPLQSKGIRVIDFVNITIDGQDYPFSNSPRPLYNYGVSPDRQITGVGLLAKIGDATRDIKSTANETTVTLSGIDPSMLQTVLGQRIKGSPIKMWHGFVDENNQLYQNLIAGSESVQSGGAYVVKNGALVADSVVTNPVGKLTTCRINYTSAIDQYDAPIVYQDIPTGLVTGRTFNFSAYLRKAGTDPAGYYLSAETISEEGNKIPNFSLTSGKWFGYCGSFINQVYGVAAADGTATGLYINRMSSTSCGAAESWGILYSDSANRFYKAGETWTVRVWAKGPAGASFQLGLDDSHDATRVFTSTWTQHTATFTVTADGTRGFQIRILTANIGGCTFSNPEVLRGTPQKFSTTTTVSGGVWARNNLQFTCGSANTDTMIRVGVKCPTNPVAGVTSKGWTDCWQFSEGNLKSYRPTALATRDWGIYQFFSGICNTFSISEQFIEELRQYVGTITVAASSIQLILQNKIVGRYTNSASWKQYNATDTSMDRVAFIATINYQFGKDAPPDS